MPRPAAPSSTFSTVALAADLDSVLAQIPTAAGVGHLLGEEGRSLMIGRPSNLRRWLASNLGRATVKKGQRPPTDLTPVARTARFALATSTFHQRLMFERLMAQYVPASARRDLKTPAYLNLDATERFPRVTLQWAGAGRADLIGPFRDRGAADRARQGLHKMFPLRPCDYRFEPAPDLALGQGCIYAQVRTCAAPCLSRVSEEGYRDLAVQALRFVSAPSGRTDEPPSWLPPFVAPASVRAVIAEAGRDGLELYPVRAGVLDEACAVVVGSEDVEAALTSLEWRPPQVPGADEAWLASWLGEKRRRGVYVVVEQEAHAAQTATSVALIRAALDPP
jgi:hypothetical protein